MNAIRDAMARRYLDALLGGDRMRALQVIVDDALASGLSIPDLYLHIIQPEQHELGRLWEENGLSVAQEHVGTTISQFVVSFLYHYLPRARRIGKKVLIGCVEGERHDMGTHMCADFLEMVGFDVRLFGADLPTSSLMELIEIERPDLVGLSISTLDMLPPLERAVLQIRERFDSQLKIAIGGQVVLGAPHLAEQLGVLAPGKDAHEVATTLLEVLHRGQDPENVAKSRP